SRTASGAATPPARRRPAGKAGATPTSDVTAAPRGQSAPAAPSASAARAASAAPSAGAGRPARASDLAGSSAAGAGAPSTTSAPHAADRPVSATYGARQGPAVAESAAAAARTLYETYGPRIFTFCVSRLRDAEEAQDATQTTFLYALRALDNGVEPRSELAWLLAIAHNVCRSTRRTRNRRDARISYADVTELEAAAESIGAESGEDLEWLRSGLEGLPENQRRAILLRGWQGPHYP